MRDALRKRASCRLLLVTRRRGPTYVHGRETDEKDRQGEREVQAWTWQVGKPASLFDLSLAAQYLNARMPCYF
jgi:hypothetical protein